MRRRNMLGKGGIEYVFSAQTTSTSVTACATSVAINLTSTANGENAPYTIYTYSGKVTGGTTGETSITIRFNANTGTSQQSGSITLKQTGSNKTITIYVYQSAGSGYTFTTTSSTSQNVNAASGYTTIYYTSRNSCSTVTPSYTKSGTMITSVTCYSTFCYIYYSKNTDEANTRSGTVTLTQGGSGKQITITLTQDKDGVRYTSNVCKRNVTMNYTKVTAIGTFECSANAPTTAATGLDWNCNGPAFAIIGDGTYVDGSYISKTPVYYYYSGKVVSGATQTTYYSGTVTNGFSMYQEYYDGNAGDSKQVTVGNITCTMTIVSAGMMYTYLTLSYGSIVSPQEKVSHCW